MNKTLWALMAVALASALACGGGGKDTLIASAANTASAVSGSGGNVDQEVIQVVRNWINAIPKHDTDRIGQLLADDFVAILPDGRKRTKAEHLEEIRSAKYAVESMTLEDATARMLGDAAVVTYYQFETSRSNGVDSSGGSAWTDVLVKRDGRWQVVAEHGSRFLGNR